MFTSPTLTTPANFAPLHGLLWYGRKYFGLILVLGAWGGVMFLNIYTFGYPSVDSWAYFAPAAFSTIPLHLSTPLLDNFEGADHCWGLNWPGGLLLSSLITPFLPKVPAIYVIISLGEWLLLSALVCSWMKLHLHHQSLLQAAFFLCLFDHNFYQVSWNLRHEHLAAISLVGAAYGTHHILQKKIQKGGGIVLGVSFLCLPLIQPVCLLIGLLLIFTLLCELCLRPRAETKAGLILAITTYGAGLFLLFFYFSTQPLAWETLKAHFRSNLKITYFDESFYFGGIFFKTLLEPAYLGDSLLVSGALITLFFQTLRWINSDSRPSISCDLILNPLLFLSILTLTQLHHDTYYFSLIMPFALTACFVALDEWIKLDGAGRKKALLIILILCGAQSSHVLGRTYFLSKAGWPHFRSELNDLAIKLPLSSHLFIPEVMWESALHDQNRFTLNTLPYATDIATRKIYEEMIYGQVRRGDILLLDSLQGLQPSTDLSRWERIGEKKCTFLTNTTRGFDITIWRFLGEKNYHLPTTKIITNDAIR